MPKRRFSRQLPLRWRLTLWYLLTLGLILLLFAAFLYLELRSSLLSQLVHNGLNKPRIRISRILYINYDIGRKVERQERKCQDPNQPQSF